MNQFRVTVICYRCTNSITFSSKDSSEIYTTALNKGFMNRPTDPTDMETDRPLICRECNTAYDKIQDKCNQEKIEFMKTITKGEK